MVERDRKALTDPDDSFGPQWIERGRVHRKRDKEVWVAQMYIRAYLLQVLSGTEDSQDGQVMRRHSGRYRSCEVRGRIVVNQSRQRASHCRGDMGDTEPQHWLVVGTLITCRCGHLGGIECGASIAWRSSGRMSACWYRR